MYLMRNRSMIVGFALVCMHTYNQGWFLMRSLDRLPLFGMMEHHRPTVSQTRG